MNREENEMLWDRVRDLEKRLESSQTQHDELAAQFKDWRDYQATQQQREIDELKLAVEVLWRQFIRTCLPSILPDQDAVSERVDWLPKE